MVSTHSKKALLGGLHYCVNHTGKMSGIESLSTSPNLNKMCNKRHSNNNTICSKCFAKKMQKRYTNLEKALMSNTEILTSRILADSELPVVKSPLFRFEAFGDLNNKTQVLNYFHICKKSENKAVKFALWTKNPWIIAEALKEEAKPENLQIILSSCFLNTICKASRYPFIDKVFTVFTPSFIEANDIDINCGARSCATCQRCYNKTSELVYIAEKLK